MFPQITPVVKNIIIINVLMFVATIANVIPNFGTLMAGHYPLSNSFEIWQVVTHMFMHGGFTHILFNMFGVFIFGAMLERVWGPKRFLIYYMITGIGAFAMHFLVVYLELRPLYEALTPEMIEKIRMEGPDLIAQDMNWTNPVVGKFNHLLNGSVVGASGALFGLLVAFAMLFPNTPLMLIFFPVPIKAKWFVLGYAAIELYMGVRNSPGDNVAHFAHLGGALVGFILMKIWQTKKDTFY